MTFALILRELTLAKRQGNALFNPLWFFIMVITLFPLSLGTSSALLKRIAPAIILIALLLSLILSLERLFKEDFNDGSLEQLLLLPQSLLLLILSKIFVHWVLISLPLLSFLPLVALLFSLSSQLWPLMIVTFLLVTPTLMFIGAIGAALTVSLPKGSLLLSLIILPLYVPVLIFATLAIDAAMTGMAITSYLAILAALLSMSVTFAPIVIVAALKINLS